MQKAMIHAELRTRRAYEVYPKLYELLHDANGFVAMYLKASGKLKSNDFERVRDSIIAVHNYRITNLWMISSSVNQLVIEAEGMINKATGLPWTPELPELYRTDFEAKMRELTSAIGSELMPSDDKLISMN